MLFALENSKAEGLNLSVFHPPTGYLFHPLIFLTPALFYTPHQLNCFHSTEKVQSPTVTSACLHTARRSLLAFALPHRLHMRTTLQVIPYTLLCQASQQIRKSYIDIVHGVQNNTIQTSNTCISALVFLQTRET
jgi:hypothetical protein